MGDVSGPTYTNYPLLEESCDTMASQNSNTFRNNAAVHSASVNNFVKHSQ